MGCLRLKNDNHERRIIKMTKTKKNNKSIKNDSPNNNQSNKKVIQISLGGVVGIVVTIAVAAVSATWIIASNFGDIKGDIISLNKDVTNLNTELSQTSAEISKMHNYLYNDDGVEDQLGDITTEIEKMKELFDLKSLIASTALTDDVANISVEPNNISTVTTTFTATTCIGTDSDGNTYIAKDLIDKTILLTFVQDDKEIYFLGQYNENYHWDGYCVTNTYNLDGSLFGICESTFDDGNRLDYESFYMSETKNEWIYTDRDCSKDENGNVVNKGDSIRYNFNYGETKNFTSTNVRVTDMLYIEDFQDSKDRTMLSHYSGATSDGVYNDESGDAYLIKYNKKGFVKTFYKGRFKDGYFQDEDALEIVLDESNNINRYFIYEGKFENGSRENDESIRYITQEEIDKIMKENGISIDLKWYGEC